MSSVILLTSRRRCCISCNVVDPCQYRGPCCSQPIRYPIATGVVPRWIAGCKQTTGFQPCLVLVKFCQSAWESLNAHRYAPDFIDTLLLQYLQWIIGARQLTTKLSQLALRLQSPWHLPRPATTTEDCKNRATLEGPRQVSKIVKRTI